jgi:adenine deaminase
MFATCFVLHYYFESVDEIAQYMQTALGQHRPTLIIKDVNVVDVHQGATYESNVWIFNDRIVAVTRKETECPSVIDGRGMYLAPGFMDAHMHIEPTMLLPSELARLVLRCGVTAIFADPHEIANVFGGDGVRELVRLSEGVPLRIFVQVPSRVPTAEGLEDSGASFDLETIRKLLSIKNAATLGELNYQNLFSNPRKFISEIYAADNLGKIVNGHLAGASLEQIDAAAAVGLADDHECVSSQEAVERARRGLAVLVREGSPERNLRDILSDLKLNDYRSYLMCSDDKHPDDILREGHIDFNVRLAIKSGVDPITAIQMATINTAQHFGLEHLIGSVTPGRKADLILFKGLEQVDIKATIFDGRIAYNDGKVLFSDEPPKPLPRFLDSIRINSEIRPNDLAIGHGGRSAKVNVIEVTEGQILKGKGLANLPVERGLIASDPSSDVVHVAVVERHRGLKSIGHSFVTGFSVKDGAISSSVSHDHHNIIIVGDNVGDMYLALKELERIKGGFACTSKGKVLHSIPLQFGGLISLERYETLLDKLKKLNEMAKLVGTKMKSPFIQLEFLSLPSVPELGITNRGLIDVRNWRIIDPVLS